MDKIGIISKCVWDAALGLSIIAGYDQKDQTSLPGSGYDYTKHAAIAGKNLKVKIAIPKEYTNVDDVVEKAFWKSIKRLEDLGATYTEVSLPSTKYALAAYYIIATSEASTNLAKYCGLRYGLHDSLGGDFNEYFSRVRAKGFGTEAKRRIILGTFARMSGYRKAYYLKAMQARNNVINDFKLIFKKYDCIAAPTMPILPPKFNEIEKLTPMQHYAIDKLTVPVNLAGMPHISVPCERMIGLHLIGDHMQEGKLIEIASAFEGGKE